MGLTGTELLGLETLPNRSVEIKTASSRTYFAHLQLKFRYKYKAR